MNGFILTGRKMMLLQDMSRTVALGNNDCWNRGKNKKRDRSRITKCLKTNLTQSLQKVHYTQL